MQQNVGTVDKIVRIVVGLALLSLLYFVQPPMNYLGLIGLVPLLTALTGRCFLYRLIGVNTCKAAT